MGTFSTSCEIANISNRELKVAIPEMIVDTGSEFTWAPRAELERIGIGLEKKDLAFVMDNGQQISRSVGFAIIRVEGRFTLDEVVFAEDGDLLLLGASWRGLTSLSILLTRDWLQPDLCLRLNFWALAVDLFFIRDWRLLPTIYNAWTLPGPKFPLSLPLTIRRALCAPPSTVSSLKTTNLLN